MQLAQRGLQVIPRGKYHEHLLEKHTFHEGEKTVQFLRTDRGPSGLSGRPRQPLQRFTAKDLLRMEFGEVGLPADAGWVWWYGIY